MWLVGMCYAVYRTSCLATTQLSKRGYSGPELLRLMPFQLWPVPAALTAGCLTQLLVIVALQQLAYLMAVPVACCACPSPVASKAQRIYWIKAIMLCAGVVCLLYERVSSGDWHLY